MASLKGYPQTFAGDTSQIDSSALHPVGTRAVDGNGNEYVYALGVGSTVAGSWVSFDEALATTLLVANAVGRVGVAMAAIVANKYGWYQIYGKNTIALADDVADNKPLYIDNNTGQVDDAGVAGDLVFGAISRSEDTTGMITVELSYPYVCDGAYLT
jgi:hypothetical protein